MSQAFRCNGLDTPQAYILNEKDSQKMGPWKFRDWAQIALFGPLEILKGPDISQVSLTPAGHLGHFGPNLAHLSPQKGRNKPDTGQSVC